MTVPCHHLECELSRLREVAVDISLGLDLQRRIALTVAAELERHAWEVSRLVDRITALLDDLKRDEPPPDGFR